MRPTQVLLGGGRRFFYPKHVWTPAGGYWNHNPPGARKSLPYILAFWVGSTFLVYNIGTENAVSVLSTSSMKLYMGT